MTKAKHILPIEGCIAPQFFSIENEKIIFFEKVNSEEGRFFTSDENGFNAIYNVYESQGIIERGELYTVNIGSVTTIKRVSGSPISIEINGTYFDFKVDSDSNIICLGHNGENSIIKIFSPLGEEIKSITIKKLLFASAIKVVGDEIFVSGFNYENKLKLITINYIGAILDEIYIDADAENRLISKIQLDSNRIYLTINGKNDSIYIMKKSGEKIREVNSKDINLKELIDFNVKDEKIYILSNKHLHIYSIKEIIVTRKKIIGSLFLKSNIKINYAYFMLIEIIKNNFLLGIILSSVLYTLIYEYVQLTTIKSVFFIWISSACFSLSIGCFKLRNKSTRIMFLLNLQSKSFSRGPQRSLFISTIILSTLSLLFVNDSRIISGIACGLILLLIFLIDRAFEGDLSRKKEDIIIELLTGDKNLTKNLKSLINHPKKGEKILLSIKVEKDFNKNYLSKWNESRSFILGKDLNYIFLDKTFISVVDLSNRDIKYSKISILSDLICYIGEKGKVKEVNAMWVD